MAETAEVALEWERARAAFEIERRTLAELEALTGRSWIANRRNEPAYTYGDRFPGMQ